MSEGDDLCLKCGRCCRRKFLVGHEVVFSDVYCKFLDPDTKLCTIFEERFVGAPHCLNRQQTIDAEFFPNDCPYVKDMKPYHGPREATPEELELYHRRIGE